MVARLIVVAVLAASLGGCIHTSNCAGWVQINPSRKDVLTEGTEAQILTHNLHGRDQCGWKPKRR